MFWCSLVGAVRPPKEAMPVAIAYLEQEDWGLRKNQNAPRPSASSGGKMSKRLGGIIGCLLGTESDLCGENSRWKGPTFRQVRVHFGKSGYSSGEK